MNFLPINLGLSGFVGGILYTVAIVAVILSLTWRPIAGLLFLIPMLPLQTVRYRLNDYPLGASVVYVIIVAVAIGVMRQGRSIFPSGMLTRPVLLYLLFLGISLVSGSVLMHFPLPTSMGDPRLADWANMAAMMLLLPLTAACVTNEREARWVLFAIFAGMFVSDRSFYTSVAGRDFSSYSEGLRDSAGAAGFAGVNGLAALSAQFTTFLLGFGAYVRSRKWWLATHALAIFSAVCVVLAISRGAYVAVLAGWLFIGFVRRRSLIVLFLLFLACWQSVVPNAVVERVTDTYSSDTQQLDGSSAKRITLWTEAIDTIKSGRAAFGNGYNTYAFSEHAMEYRDSHNYFLKILWETGVVGLLLFLWLVFKIALCGLRLSWSSADPFLRGIGLGLAGWIVAAMFANMFGDRWSYLQVQGPMWVLGGLAMAGLGFVRGSSEVTGEEAAEGEWNGQELAGAEGSYAGAPTHI